MIYDEIIINNFKGIKNIELNLKNNRIITLVGLNESGKTTIMEAIKLFHRTITGYKMPNTELNSLRPKGIDFTGVIEFGATLLFEDEDIKKIMDYFGTIKNKKQNITLPSKFGYTIRLEYDLHQYKKMSETIECVIKDHNDNSLYDKNNEKWNLLITYMQTLVPEILYFDDFIFEIPEHICFPTNSNINGDCDNINESWKLVIDDILKSVNPQLNFLNHIYEIWSEDRDAARNRISQMEKVLNQKITKKWKELFGKDDLNFQEIKLDVELLSDQLCLSFKILAKNKKEFSVNERSKGFKWFFSFLLFTEFRKKRTKNILFLLDEPASNLHSSAQAKILDAINELSKDSLVIYSTHSHHLINPNWLSGTYVCINENLSENVLSGDFNESNTAIRAEKYYSYVGKGFASDRVSYFQPILDSLDYKPSTVEPIPNIIITEGKNDWYSFKYFSEVISTKNFEINFYPGSGATKLYDIIRLYLAWGRNFVVILDGDKTGKSYKKKYNNEFGKLIEDKIFTLYDIFNSEFETEDLINAVDKKNIICEIFGEETYNNLNGDLKETLNKAINELLVKNKKLKLSKSNEQFEKLFYFINKKLKPSEPNT